MSEYIFVTLFFFSFEFCPKVDHTLVYFPLTSTQITLLSIISQHRFLVLSLLRSFLQNTFSLIISLHLYLSKHTRTISIYSISFYLLLKIILSYLFYTILYYYFLILSSLVILLIICFIFLPTTVQHSDPCINAYINASLSNETFILIWILLSHRIPEAFFKVSYLNTYEHFLNCFLWLMSIIRNNYKKNCFSKEFQKKKR